MRSYQWTILGVALAIAGCSNPSSTTVSDGQGNKVTSQDGKVTYEGAGGEKATFEADQKGGGTMTYSGKDGEQKVSTGTEVNEEELGVEFYPGSKAKEGASVKADTPEATSWHTVRLTSDDPTKVVAYYKPKVKDASSVSTGGQEMLMGKLEDGASIQITAGREEGSSETTVNVTVVREKKKK